MNTIYDNNDISQSTEHFEKMTSIL